ncbi:MAG TPA: aldehyde dehydrogenase family protein [Caulobacter sp.]|nr:aldehyde dehydrogenase family protein [Caulobacter sp.]
MHGSRHFYVDGRWVKLTNSGEIEVFAPTTEARCGSLAGSGHNLIQARALARRFRSGEVILNGSWENDALFGGYKQSGDGRGRSVFGLEDFLETKAIVAHGPAA